MKWLYGILTAALLVSGANAQSGSTVKQSGSITPSSVPSWVTNGVIGGGVTAADSPITSFGVTSNTTAGICVSSGRATATGRQQLCFGAPLSSNAVISLQNYGTATAQGLDLVINGVTSSIPSNGGDFVTGTGPYAAGGVPCFTSTTSAVTDCGLVLSSGTITTGNWAGTAIPVAFGGTGAATAATARTNLGLGTISTQNASAVAITGGTITGMPVPSATTDVAIKSYVDALASGLNILAQSTLATAAVLPNTPTYANGASGVGATLTAGSNTTLTVDGTAAPLNTVVLVKNQASTFQNGIYTVTTAGDGSNPWVLTRATYFDQAAEMKAGSYTFITSGATNVNSSWTLQAAVTTVGVDALSFVQFANSAAGISSVTIAAGTGLATSGTCAITTFGTCTVSLTSPVTPANGGTGVNNGSATLTLLSGNFVGSFVGTATLLNAGVSNSTLPTGSHTLAISDAAQTFTGNQAFTGRVSITASGGFAFVERLALEFQGASEYGMYINEDTGTSTGSYIVFGRVGNQAGAIVQNGGTNVAYTTSSDRRLKDDLRPVGNVRDEIASINVYDFRWKATGERNRGFMAQDIVKVVPEAVRVGDDTNPWQLDYGRITPLLWANARDVNARIDALEKEIERLKGTARVRYGSK